MDKNLTVKKILMIVAVVVLLGSSFAILYFSLRHELGDYEQRSSTIIEINNLQQQKAELYSQIEELETNRDMTETGGASVFLLFDYADTNLYELVYPTVTYHEFRAIFTFAPGQTPNGGNNLTVGQYKELLAADWEGAIKYSAGVDINETKAEFDALEIPFPEIMVFDEGEYDSSMADGLHDLGINICICAADDDEELPDDGMMKIKSEPIMYNQSVVKLRTNRAMNSGMPLVVRTGHVKRYVDDRSKDCDLEKYEEMMRWLKIMQFQERLRVQNTYDNDSVMDMLNYSIEQANASQAEINRINSEIAELDDEILSLRRSLSD